MRILTDNTGKGQLEILSALTRESGQRQSELVENTSLSKGAVSNNVRKLREKDLIVGKEEIELNFDRVQELYREHVETFLIRESSEPDNLNDLRTYVKRNISEILDQGEVFEVIEGVLNQVSEREDLESLNSVFKEADRIIKETGEVQELKMLGLATDKSNTVTDNNEIAEEAERILNEVKK